MVGGAETTTCGIYLMGMLLFSRLKSSIFLIDGLFILFFCYFLLFLFVELFILSSAMYRL